MRPVIDTLENIHKDTGEPEALGMLRTMKTYNFVAILMMLSDVLPAFTCLSRALQAKTADFTLVASKLTYVQHSLQQIKEHPKVCDLLQHKILLTIAMVLPVSTATVEHSFSDMKQIKDQLHNRLLPASMFKLMIIAIEGPPLHEVDFDAVLALWKAMKPRRLLM